MLSLTLQMHVDSACRRAGWPSCDLQAVYSVGLVREHVISCLAPPSVACLRLTSSWLCQATDAHFSSLTICPKALGRAVLLDRLRHRQRSEDAASTASSSTTGGEESPGMGWRTERRFRILRQKLS